MARFEDVGRFDPLPAFRFTLTIGGQDVGHFSECTGMSMEVDKIEYREGGYQGIMTQIPGLARGGDITLRRGLSGDATLEVWFNQIFSLTGLTNLPPDPAFRKNLILSVQKRGGITARAWAIFRTWPSRYTPGEFNATASEVAIEEVVLCHEGFIPVAASGAVIAPPAVI
jgi:phage tail-like protein